MRITGANAMFGNLLSRRIIQLVFPRPLEALLNTNILPQSLNCVANLWWQDVAFDLGGLHEDGLDVVLHSLILEREFEGLHSLENDAHGLNGVAENDFLERLSLVARIAALVDKLHLLQNGGFSGFTST